MTYLHTSRTARSAVRRGVNWAALITAAEAVARAPRVVSGAVLPVQTAARPMDADSMAAVAAVAAVVAVVAVVASIAMSTRCPSLGRQPYRARGRQRGQRGQRGRRPNSFTALHSGTAARGRAASGAKGGVLANLLEAMGRQRRALQSQAPRPPNQSKAVRDFPRHWTSPSQRLESWTSRLAFNAQRAGHRRPAMNCRRGRFRRLL